MMLKKGKKKGRRGWISMRWKHAPKIVQHHPFLCESQRPVTPWQWNWKRWPPFCLLLAGWWSRMEHLPVIYLFISLFFGWKHLKHRHAVWHWRSLCVPRRVAYFYQKRSLVFHVEMLFFSLYSSFLGKSARAYTSKPTHELSIRD